MLKKFNGSTPGRLLGFSLPIFCANFLQIIYALTDMAVVGRYNGEEGLAAIANGSIITYLIGSIGSGLAVGGAVVIGHYHGAGQLQAQRESLATVLIMAAVTAGLLAPLGLIYAEDVFRFLDVAEKARPEAAAYLGICGFGNIFFFCGTALSLALRSWGDSRSPLYFMLFGGLINIVLDLVLVGPLALGVRGAALATTAAQGGALLFAAVYLKRRGFISGGFRFRSAQARRILRIGLPSMLQMLVINCSYLAITMLINGYGVNAAAAAGVGLKVCTLAVMPCWAIGQALTAMAANSLGAGDPGQAENLTRAALRLNLLVSALIVALVQLAAQPIMAFFNPGAPEVVREGLIYLRLCCSLGVLLYAAMYTFNCLATAAGAASAALLNSLFDSVLMRLFLIWLFSRAGLGLSGIYLGQALSALLPAVGGALYFYSCRWRRARVI